MNKEILEKDLSMLHSMLYILELAKNGLDRHKLFKIIYFAERSHLAQYGQQITEDHYVAMKYGPVPSAGYRFIQILDGDQYLQDYFKAVSKYLTLQGKTKVAGKILADRDELSETAIEHLLASYKENILLSFKYLTDKSYDLAWNSVKERNSKMSVIDMARAANANKVVLNYLKDSLDLKNSRLVAG